MDPSMFVWYKKLQLNGSSSKHFLYRGTYLFLNDTSPFKCAFTIGADHCV